jgi:hypothetical protein
MPALCSDAGTMNQSRETVETVSSPPFHCTPLKRGVNGITSGYFRWEVALAEKSPKNPAKIRLVI